MARYDLIVVDTNVVSYILNNDPVAEFYKGHLHDKRAVISFQTLGELWYGAYSDGWGEKRRKELASHIKGYDVIWSSPNLVEIWAQLHSQQKSVGHMLSDADAWVASTAIMLDCPLASHDRDFVDIPDLELIQAPN